MPKYVLVCGGASGAPQLEVNVHRNNDEDAMTQATGYSEMISNRWYWNFTLCKDGKPFMLWTISLNPVVKNVRRAE